MNKNIRYSVRLAYDGAAYHGWQIQENAYSVQAEITACIKKLLGTDVSVIGCGRTDKGVHAKEFYLHFDLPKPLAMEEDKFLYKCNAILPKDIVFYEIKLVRKEWHARFSALSRSYEYHLHTHKSAFLNQYSFFYPFEVDVPKMNEAAKILFEYIDFSSFSKSKTQTKTNDCKIMEAYWERTGGQLVFHITADRFLRNMVRAIVGTLLEVGKGRLSQEEFRQIIESKNRSNAGMSVPGNALFLTKIMYPEN